MLYKQRSVSDNVLKQDRVKYGHLIHIISVNNYGCDAIWAYIVYATHMLDIVWYHYVLYDANYIIYAANL